MLICERNHKIPASLSPKIGKKLSLKSQVKFREASEFFRAAALITTIVLEYHPRSQHKGSTSMQIHWAVRIGFKLATNCIQFYVFATRLRYP